MEKLYWSEIQSFTILGSKLSSLCSHTTIQSLEYINGCSIELCSLKELLNLIFVCINVRYIRVSQASRPISNAQSKLKYRMGSFYALHAGFTKISRKSDIEVDPMYEYLRSKQQKLTCNHTVMKTNKSMFHRII